jgi:hypothetical protein
MIMIIRKEDVMSIGELRSKNANYVAWGIVKTTSYFTPNVPLNEKHVISGAGEWPASQNDPLPHRNGTTEEDLAAHRDAMEEPGDSKDFETLCNELGV